MVSAVLFGELAGGCFCGRVRYKSPRRSDLDAVATALVAARRSAVRLGLRRGYAGLILVGERRRQPELLRNDSGLGSVLFRSCGSTLCGTAAGKVHGVTLGSVDGIRECRSRSHLRRIQGAVGSHRRTGAAVSGTRPPLVPNLDRAACLAARWVASYPHATRIRPVLSCGASVGSPGRALDVARRSRASRGRATLQSDPPRRAAPLRHVAKAALATLEYAGIVTHSRAAGGADYRLTRAGQALRPIVRSVGEWGQRWAREIEARDLDPGWLVWSMHRRLNVAAMPPAEP